MKGKHEWGNEGADVVSGQITISTDYWRGKRLIELFYHTESLRLSPHRKPIPLPRRLVGGSHMCVEKLSRFWVTVFAADGDAVLFICHVESGSGTALSLRLFADLLLLLLLLLLLVWLLIFWLLVFYCPSPSLPLLPVVRGSRTDLR